MISKLSLLLSSLLLVTYVSLAQKNIFEINELERGTKLVNVAYDAPNDPSKKMDVYLAKYAHSQTPFIVLIHNGLYDRGSKRSVAALAEQFMAEDMSVIALDYRHVSNKAFSERSTDYVDILTDIWRAMSFANLNAADWRLTPNNFTLIGEGAGAHLALLAAYKFHESVRNVIAISPITDLRLIPTMDRLAGNRNKTRTLFSKLVGNVPFSLKGQLPYQYIDASPIMQIRNVPTLLIHDRYNNEIPFEQSQNLYNALRDKDISARLVAMEGGKTNLLSSSSVQNMTWAEILYWLDKHNKR